MKFVPFLYNLFFPLALILILPSYLPRMFRRGGYHGTFFQRFGFFDRVTQERIGHGRIWIHAVSVGELFIALKFINNFHERHPEARFILSVTTTTGLEIAHKEASLWLEPIASPLDFFFITNQFLARFEPSALIMVEGDLWPQRLWHCKKQGIPTAMISARLSQRSEKRFGIFARIIAPLFNLLDFIGFPSSSDQERWNHLGIYGQSSLVTGNLKFDQVTAVPVLLPKNQEVIFASLGWSKEDLVFLAGSTTCLAEEEEIVQAWLSLKADFPRLRLVMVPRHAERRHELVTLFQKYQIHLTLRSITPLLPSDVLLLDTTGELQSWYRMASVVFMGKSLGMVGARGGHNLVEPLMLGRPVLVGPCMDNFEPLTSNLLHAQAIMLVHDKQEIVAAIKNVLLYPQAAASMVERAFELLQEDQGSIERTSRCIEKILYL